MAQINKPSAPLVPPTTDADVENIVNEAIASDDTHASLVNGEVPSAQLPSYVDDVLEFDAADEFPAEGETGKIYVALDTNYTYRWSGAAYVQVGGASLGEGNGIEINNDLVSVKFAETESGLNFNGNNELVVDFNTVADHVAGSGGGSFIYSTESHYLDVRIDQVQQTLQNDENFQTWVDERAEAVAAAAAPTYFGDSGSLAFNYLFNGVDESLHVKEENDTLHMGVDPYWLDTQIRNVVPTYGPGIAADSDGSGQIFWYVDTGYLNENLEFEPQLNDGNSPVYYIEHYAPSEMTNDEKALLQQVWTDFRYNNKRPRLYYLAEGCHECLLRYVNNKLHVLAPMVAINANNYPGGISYFCFRVDSTGVSADNVYFFRCLSLYNPNDTGISSFWDTIPTSNSTKAITSGGVYTALAAKADASAVYTKSEVDSAIAAAIGDVLNQGF